MMAAGLRANAKALEHPPEPKIGAPVLDPTTTGNFGSTVALRPLISALLQSPQQPAQLSAAIGCTGSDGLPDDAPATARTD